MNNPDRCRIGRCRKESTITVMGKNMCWDHWSEHCDNPDSKLRFTQVQAQPDIKKSKAREKQTVLSG